ncbi:MAG: hypothetical protein AAGH46_05835 [Bacteroidota bacterium]
MKIKKFAYWKINNYEIDKLRQSQQFYGTLTVHENDDAAIVAEFTEQTLKVLIIVVNDRNEVVGVISPKVLLDRLNEITNGNFKNLSHAISEMSVDPIERRRDFIHEANNYTHVELNWCDRHRHLTSDKPCKINP